MKFTYDATLLNIVSSAFHTHPQSEQVFLISRKPELLKTKSQISSTESHIFNCRTNSPGASFDDGRGDVGQLPLELLPQLVRQLVGGHLVVEHEVDWNCVKYFSLFS